MRAPIQRVKLSQGQMDILICLLNGYEVKEISRALGRSESSIRTSIQVLHEKLGARTRAHLAKRALVVGAIDAALFFATPAKWYELSQDKVETRYAGRKR